MRRIHERLFSIFVKPFENYRFIPPEDVQYWEMFGGYPVVPRTQKMARRIPTRMSMTKNSMLVLSYNFSASQIRMKIPKDFEDAVLYYGCPEKSVNVFTIDARYPYVHEMEIASLKTVPATAIEELVVFLRPHDSEKKNKELIEACRRLAELAGVSCVAYYPHELYNVRDIAQLYAFSLASGLIRDELTAFKPQSTLFYKDVVDTLCNFAPQFCKEYCLEDGKLLKNWHIAYDGYLHRLGSMLMWIPDDKIDEAEEAYNTYAKLFIKTYFEERVRL